ncbi:MAG: hypothetical protein ACYCVD_10490 [Desulfitobacteriaceae bacterium]
MLLYVTHTAHLIDIFLANLGFQSRVGIHQALHLADVAGLHHLLHSCGVMEILHH